MAYPSSHSRKVSGQNINYRQPKTPKTMQQPDPIFPVHNGDQIAVMIKPTEQNIGQ
jgi:hypothetical protein